MDDVILDIEDPVAVVRLNRPARLNAFTYKTIREIREAVDAAAADTRAVGIIITGTGRGFSAGLDIETLQETTSRGSAEMRGEGPAEGELPGLFSYLLHVPKPVIGALNGVAAGGGFVLAVMCDVRIASADASFVTSFLQRGLIAEHGTSWILPRLLGPGRALDLFWTGRRMGAEEALRLGLVEEVVPPEQLMERAVAYINEIASKSSPASIADTKRLVYRHLGVGYTEALHEADEAQWRAIDRPDSKEGALSFAERRPPRFQRLGDS